MGPQPAHDLIGRDQLLSRLAVVVARALGGDRASLLGLADIATLVSKGGAEVHVLELVEATARPQLAGDVVDRQALTSYRRRLVDLDDDLEEACRHQDLELRPGCHRSARQCWMSSIG